MAISEESSPGELTSEEANVVIKSSGQACCHKKGVSQRLFQDTAVGSYKSLI